MKNGKRHPLKKNGNVRAWVCKCCGAPYCDPMFLDNRTHAGKKILLRKLKGLCIACGKKECKCKNINRGSKQ